MSNSKKALIVQYSSNRDGSAYSGLLLANGFREAGWDTYVAFGFEGPMVERYASAGHQTHLIPHDNWLRRGLTHQFAKDVYLEWQKANVFKSLMEEIAPDVVYVNTVVSLAGAIAARRKGAPCVWHLREMFSDIGGEMQAPSWTVPFVRWVLRRHADRLVANSTATARNLLGDNVSDVTVIPNAVRSDFFDEDRTQAEARAVFNLRPDGTVIGVPGTLRPMKGHPFFFDAVAPLLRVQDDLRVAVTGEGDADFARQLREQIRNFGIQDRVLLLGWIDEMPAFYRACDLVCIPSRAEPFGRTAIEAFAVGTPVVASDVGGLQEIVTDGETGQLVSYGDEEALENAVRFFLERPDVRQKIANSARRTAEEKYHERVYKDHITTLVTKTVSHGDHLSRT